jgi:phage shock protein C
MEKNQNDKVLAGVCSGMATSLGVDPIIVRLLFVLGTLTTGVVPGLVVYVAAALIMK